MNEHDNSPSLKERITLWLIPILGAALALSGVTAMAMESDQGVFGSDAGLGSSELSRPANQGRWGFAYENDFFVPGGRDQDYTYGLSYSYSSASIDDRRFHRPLYAIDKLIGLEDADFSRRAYEGGIYGFTPEDISASKPQHDDRPFASLVYFSTSKDRVNSQQHSVVRSQITYGMLGLEIVGQVQDQFHKLIGNDSPKGWHNQISNGGEPTLRYSLSKQSLIATHASAFELRQTRAFSLGYLTEVNWGLSMRTGKLNSSWHSFTPELASYAESSSSSNKSRGEGFFWAGFAIKARAYNAFLQGQFRQSAVSYSSSELNHIIIEAWGGYTQSFINGYYVSYGLRGHSSEVKSGTGNRQVIWGGLMLGKRWT